MPAPKRNALPAWVSPTLQIVIALIAVTIYIEHRFSGVSDRLLKVEQAVRTLGNSQNEPLKSIIHDLLAVAANPDTAPATAAKATDSANVLLVALRDKKDQADQQFFASTVSTLNDISKKRLEPEVVNASFKVRTSLADYRSALVPTPAAIGANVWHIYKVSNAITIFPNTPVIGGNLELSGVSGDAVVVGKLDPRVHLDSPPGLPKFDGTLFQNGQQTLDGIEWVNVIFYNMRIRYNGGKLILRNVTFVNCTFDVAPTTRGAQVADYAALQQTGALTIG
jgi:hypothetical protein